MRRLILSALLPLFAYAGENDPYFGGTLLSTIPVNIAPAHWLIEPYLYITRQTDRYLSTQQHFTSIQMLWEFETGLNDWVDVALYPNFYYTHSSYLLGDTTLSFGFQIAYEQKESWIPNFRLLLQESFPTGKYDHLSSHKQLADVTGSGSYETYFTSVLHKTLTPFTLNLTLNYVIPTKAHVKGFNAYGGNSHTNTHVLPGRQFIGNLGIEYSLSQCWILGLDLHYQHQTASSQPTPTVGTPSLDQFSLAPCIEYNPSPLFGIEIGSWFTLYNRNCSAFTSAVGTVYWSF